MSTKPSMLFVFLLAAALLPNCQASLMHEQAGGSPSAGGSDTTPLTAEQSFVKSPPQVYVNKIKTLMTGLPATSDDVGAVAADPNVLGSLVSNWASTPAFRDVLKSFFANEFQQTKTQSLYFTQDMDSGGFYPESELLQNFRESFARTALEIMDEGLPFTTVANTNRFMLTTAMMMYHAHADASYRTDNFIIQSAWFNADQNFTFYLAQKGGPWGMAESADPNSPHYMHFYLPTLSTAFSNMSAAEQATCSADPLPFANLNIFARANGNLDNILSYLYGGDFYNFQPREYLSNTVLCHGTGQRNGDWLVPSDYNDWRMVTISAPVAPAQPDIFFNLPYFRKSNQLKILSPKVGYFTTPAFLSQYSTNVSNSARVTANQTMIVGLGEGIDGTDKLPLTTPTAVDANHSKDPACFACHQTLDPLRQFFRRDYSLAMGRQTDTSQATLPATFAYRGMVKTGTGVKDLGDAIASHPNFATAWTVKLCTWANSAPCLATDPEVQRIAGVFAASNFQFSTLVQEVFTSPLVSYSAYTPSAAKVGQQVSLLRRNQMCTVLNQRLGLNDVCADEGGARAAYNNVPLSVSQLPFDSYVRGTNSSVFVTTPSPFVRTAFESVCADVAVQVIDGLGAPWASKNDVPSAMTKIVQDLMGLPPADSSEAYGFLASHYADVLAEKQDATLALQSTFVLGCTSIFVTSVGQ